MPCAKSDFVHRSTWSATSFVCSQFLMTVVAERRRLGALASAEHHRARARCLPFHRFEACDFVRAIAERLGLGAAAAAPPIGLARHHIDHDGFGTANLWFLSHDPAPPASVASQAAPHALANSRTRRM